MRTSELSGAKNFEFFKIYEVSARTMREEGHFFEILCGRLLRTAPNRRKAPIQGRNNGTRVETRACEHGNDALTRSATLHIGG